MSTDPDLLTISQVCARLPGARGARRVCPSTVTRWILAGCPARDGIRIKLTATRCGSRWLVRPADLDAFFAKLAADPTTTSPETRSPASRNKAAAKADDELQKMGV
ncbi:MAG TPA: helix-turn-helix domain-containing protein [Gemmata sp.]|jgi:hypothetical protein|nr:helix-turn-helix domain-containing protein [Gemmata sp.]